MKKLLFCLMIVPLYSIGQASIDTTSFNFTGIDSIDSVSAKVLMSRAKLFVAESFKSAKDVIQLDDAEGNVLVVKGNIIPIIKVPLLGKTAYGYVHFTMKVQTKDGKYKYTLSEFDHESHEQNQGSGGLLTREKPACGTFLMSKSYWRQIKEYTEADAIAFIGRLKTRMHNGDAGKKDEF